MNRDAERGKGTIRFTIPQAFEGEDDGGLIIEVAAYELGPHGGRGHQLRLPVEYWAGLLPRLGGRLEDGVAS